MLILSRRSGERIVLSIAGQQVTIDIVKILGNRAKIGIEAPLSVTVHRSELLQPSDGPRRFSKKLVPLGCRAAS